ncbi:MAG: transglycosylase family protein, partial [Micropruina sp.]
MLLTTKLVAVAASSALLAGGAIGATALDKSVTLSVDGVTSTVHGFAPTVRDVLSSKGISLTERDLVLPAPDAPVIDGATITVQYSRPVTLTVDGELVQFNTTATALDEALQEYSLHDLSDAQLSVSRSMPIGREGIEVTAITPRPITLTVAGKKQRVNTTASTVAELLAERDLSMSVDDKITPGLFTALSPSTKVKLTRIKVSTVEKVEKVPFSTMKKKSATLFVGQTKVVTPGKAGKAEVTYEVTRTNGKKVTKKVLVTKTLREPVAQVVLVGTKSPSTGGGSGGAINLARAAMWDRIAQCESGGRWSINTGNGYYGGLQFSLPTWRGVGGADFAAYPHQASRAEQITVANRLYARAGLQPWG